LYAVPDVLAGIAGTVVVDGSFPNPLESVVAVPTRTEPRYIHTEVSAGKFHTAVVTAPPTLYAPDTVAVTPKMNPSAAGFGTET
jgi:hypothetical protein